MKRLYSIGRRRNAFGHRLAHEHQAQCIIGGVQRLVELGDEIQDVQDPKDSAPRHSGVAVFQPVERLFRDARPLRHG